MLWKWKWIDASQKMQHCKRITDNVSFDVETWLVVDVIVIIVLTAVISDGTMIQSRKIKII